MKKKSVGLAVTVAIALSAVVLGAFTAAAGEGKVADKAAAASFTITALKDARWMPFDPKNPQGIQIAVISGDPTKGPHNFLLKMPAGGKSIVHAHSAEYSAVVLQGTPTVGNVEADAKPLSAGTSWVQAAKVMHFNSCPSKEECVVFISMAGPSDLIPQGAPVAAK